MNKPFLAELQAREARQRSTMGKEIWGKPMKSKKIGYRVSVSAPRPAPTDSGGGGGESQGNPTGGRRMSSYHFPRNVEIKLVCLILVIHIMVN